jgi:NCAIR mutase (PurE)-related protein
MSPAEQDARLRHLLAAVQSGARSVDDALAALRNPLAATAQLGFATVDHDRARRCGFPEVVFCQNKLPEDAAAIAAEILTRSDRVLLTRGREATVLFVPPRPHWDATWDYLRAAGLRELT